MIIKGKVSDIKIFDSGFFVGSIEGEDRILFSIKGANLPLKKGSTVEVVAKETKHPKYGLQYHIEDIISETFETTTGLIRFFASDIFSGIGSVAATHIVNYFGLDVIDALTNDPMAIFKVSELNEAQKESFYESWIAYAVENETLLKLINFGFMKGQAKKIFKAFGTDAVEKLESRVYEFIKIDGIGFESVDHLAILNGYSPDNPSRIQAAIVHCLNENSAVGHCYMDHGDLTNIVTNLLQSVKTKQVFDAIETLTHNGELIQDGLKIYLQFLHYAEKQVSHILRRLNQSYHSRFKSEQIYEFLKKYQIDNSITLDDDQQLAVVNAITQGVNIITGGPGTGKSTITKAICSFFIENNIVDYCMCAPTGRAAKRMTEVTSLPASTIHRLLDYKNGFWGYNINNPLPRSYIIVDETSMVDIQIAYALLASVAAGANIIFIGDVNQLPSVGPGQFLYDLIESDKFETTYLVNVYRQGKESFLIEVANSILEKKLIKMPNPKESQGANCVLVSASEESDVRSLLNTVLTKSLTKIGYTMEDVQILTPMRKGNLGSFKLNQFLKPIFNPVEASAPMISVNGYEYSVGDKIMHTKNNYKLGNFGKFNGDIGKILSLNESNEAQYIEIQFDDETVWYSKEDVNEIMPAFASTVHKCIKKGETVLSSEGYKCIENIQINNSVSVGGNTFMKVKDVINSGSQKIYRVQTMSGYRIDVTEKHPILIYDSKQQKQTFKLVKDINADDFILIDRSIINHHESKIHDDLAWLLGFTVGDGSYNVSDNDYRIEWASHVNSIECLYNIRDIIKNEFQYEVKIYPKNKSRNDFSNIRACAFSKQIRQKLFDLGLKYQTCNKKTIPECILHGSIDNKYSFLAGLIDSDGSVDKRGIRIVIKSEELSHNVQLLLLNLGIISVRRKDYLDAYCVQISGPSLRILKQKLNLICKAKAFKLSLIKTNSGKTNNDFIPEVQLINDFMKAKPNYQGIKNKGMNCGKHQVLGKKLYNLRTKAKLNYTHLSQMCDFLKENNVTIPNSLDKALKENYFYDKLKSREFCGEEDTFDLEIENIHSFVCNGFVCHNSQGCEYPVVICIFNPMHNRMITPRLCYTAITRARKLCIVIGSHSHLYNSLQANADECRKTSLKDRIMENARENKD